MKLLKLIGEIEDALRSAICNAICKEEDRATATVHTEDGYIDITVRRKYNFASVWANHDDIWHKYNLYNLNEWVNTFANRFCGEIAWQNVEYEMNL